MVAPQTYSIFRTDNSYDINHLDRELRAKTYSVPYYGITTDGSWIEVQFMNAAPSPTDESTVDNVLAGHTPKAPVQIDYDNLFEEITYGKKGRMDRIAYYADSTKQHLVKDVIFSYKKNKLQSVQTLEYDEYGLLVSTMAETVTYEKNRIKKIERTKT